MAGSSVAHRAANFSKNFWPVAIFRVCNMMQAANERNSNYAKLRNGNAARRQCAAVLAISQAAVRGCAVLVGKWSNHRVDAEEFLEAAEAIIDWADGRK
jgi:hypothetical protein